MVEFWFVVCCGKLGPHWVRWKLVDCLATFHYPNQFYSVPWNNHTTRGIFEATLWWLPLTTGCVLLQLLASRSRARHTGDRLLPWRQCRHRSLWIRLNLAETSKIFYIRRRWLVIPFNCFLPRWMSLSTGTRHVPRTLRGGVCNVVIPFAKKNA